MRSIAPNRPQGALEACTKRNSEWWWAWLREQPEWNAALGILQQDGSVTRQRGLSWRELAPHEIEELAGDQARARKYASRGRRMEKVLPANLRPLVAIAAAGGAWLPIEIPASRSLDESDLPRLQNICRRTLSGEKIGRADGQWRDRKLRSINPTQPIHVPASVGQLSGPVALHATALEGGELVLGASHAGWLPVGHVEPSRYGAHVPGVRPAFTFNKEPL
jgi:hypothetical protein